MSFYFLKLQYAADMCFICLDIHIHCEIDALINLYNFT